MAVSSFTMMKTNQTRHSVMHRMKDSNVLYEIKVCWHRSRNHKVVNLYYLYSQLPQGIDQCANIYFFTQVLTYEIDNVSQGYSNKKNKYICGRFVQGNLLLLDSLEGRVATMNGKQPKKYATKI